MNQNCTGCFVVLPGLKSNYAVFNNVNPSNSMCSRYAVASSNYFKCTIFSSSMATGTPFSKVISIFCAS